LVAVVELQRDYVRSLPHALTDSRLPYGLGVVSDGIHWCLIRSRMSLDAIHTEATTFFDIRDAAQAKDWFYLCVNALAVAASGAYWYDALWSPVLQHDGVKINRALAVTHASVVFLCEKTSAPRNKSFVVKVAKDSATDEAARFEREYLVWHSADSKVALQHECIVQCIADDLYGLKALLFQYEYGVAVEYMCYCGGDALNVARLVYEDVSKALQFMHSHRFAHVDIQVLFLNFY